MKIALGLEYLGTHYQGWQAQDNLPTIEGHLKPAIEFVAAHPVTLICAGRTDAGVHATGQIVHFETTVERSARAWVLGANTKLPSDIRVRFAQAMPEDFHARYSAQARRYLYWIDQRPVHSALDHFTKTWYTYPLNEITMMEAGQYLLGEHDFSAFRGSECQSKTPWRCVHHLRVFRQDHLICVDIQANAFLHHMVRNIVGSLMWVGSGRKSPSWMLDVLEGRDRTRAGPMADARGLILHAVQYPEHFGPIPGLNQINASPRPTQLMLCQ